MPPQAIPASVFFRTTSASFGVISRRTNRSSKKPVPASASAVARLPPQRLVRFCESSHAFIASTAPASPVTSSKASIMTDCVSINACAQRRLGRPMALRQASAERGGS